MKINTVFEHLTKAPETLNTPIQKISDPVKNTEDNPQITTIPYILDISNHKQNEFIHRFKNSVQHEDKLSIFKSSFLDSYSYDDSFLKEYAVTYHTIQDELSKTYSGEELDSQLKILDDAFSHVVKEASADLANTFKSFFGTFDSDTFQKHLTNLAQKALEVIKSNPKDNIENLNEKIDKTLTAYTKTSGNKLETMSYEDIKNLTNLFKNLPYLNPRTSTSPETVAKAMGKWYSLGKDSEKSLSSFISNKVSKAINNHIQKFHKSAALTLAKKNYDDSLEELGKLLDKLNSQYKKISQQLATLMKQKNKNMDQINRMLKQQGEIGSKLIAIRHQMSDIIKEKDALVNNPDEKIMDTPEYNQIETSYEKEIQKIDAAETK